jgi:hypothetical protein
MVSNEDIEFALNEHRLLVVLEQEDGKFHQILLNETQFKAVSDACVAHKEENATEGLREGMEMVYMHISDDWSLDADLFLGCSSITDTKELNENCDKCSE